MYALFNRALALTQAFVLGLLLLIGFQRALQFAAQLFDLGHQRGHGIARRIALNAQRLHFVTVQWVDSGAVTRTLA